MTLTALQKGKGRATPQQAPRASPKASRSGSDSDSESSGDPDSGDSDYEEEITQDFLDSLLEKAREHARSTRRQTSEGSDREEEDEEEEEIRLEKEPDEQPIPRLDPGKLPAPYIRSRHAGPTQIRDPDVERIENASSSLATPAAPPAPPELSKSGKPLTKKEKKALRNQTAGPGWFDLPAPAEADLPRMYREVEALRLRNQLDPKRFYRKDEGEGKGIKGLPKHFAIGTIIPSSTPFGTASADNLSRASRKRTIVDELVDDAEAKSYAKKKFKELQTVRGAKGRGTLAAKKALRKPKW